MTLLWSPDGKYTFGKKHNRVQFIEDGGLVGYIQFQDGPIQEHGVNGTTNEEVIFALIERLSDLNRPPYECEENTQAIFYLAEALAALKERTEKRMKRGVEGSSTP